MKMVSTFAEVKADSPAIRRERERLQIGAEREAEAVYAIKGDVSCLNERRCRC